MNLGSALALVMTAGLLSQWLAWRWRIPAIVLLAGVGLALGPGLNWVIPAQQFGAHYGEIVHVLVAIVLFEGGLNLRFRELREAGQLVRRLTSAGLLLTWVGGALAAHYIGGIDWSIALVIAAILVVTGPTVVIPMLKHARLERSTASTLRWEGILNDPLGVLLAVVIYQYLVNSGDSVADAVLGLGQAAVVASVLGGGGGWLIGRAFKRNWVPEYLKMPMILVAVIALSTLSNGVQRESGLLAATLMGVVMGNMRLPSIDEMRRFKEYLTILLVSFLFIVLTAAISREQLMAIDLQIVALIAAFLLLVRPVAILLATLGTDSSWQQRLLIGWIAPRGIVAAATAAAFAPTLVSSGYADADLMVPLVFGLIFASVILHGLSLAPLSRWLGLSGPTGERALIVGASPWSTALCHQLQKLGAEFLLVDSDWGRLREARQQGLPVWYGEPLSEHAEESLELGNFSSVLAASSNSAYNSLVCVTFAPDVGRQQVFELREPEPDDGSERDQLHTTRGRTAFDPGTGFAELWNRLARGWRFRATSLTEDYDLERARAGLPEEALLIASVDADGGVRWATAKGMRAGAGERLLSFCPPDSNERQPEHTEPPAVPDR